MNAKVLTLVIALVMLVPAGYAASYRFGSCPTGYDCEETPDDGGPFPPHAVTAHTIYANFIVEKRENLTLGLPTDFAAIAGYFAEIDNRTIARQRECVVWFNGYNLDQRPDPDNFGWGAENAFPSDEDQPHGPGGVPNHDESYQDYDFDRDVENCLPEFEIRDDGPRALAFAVVVEAGDCDPETGSNFRFRGHLDFVDPNDIYHEVQEYDYTCFFVGPGGGLGKTAFDTITQETLGDGGQWMDDYPPIVNFGGGGLVPDGAAAAGGPALSDAVKDFFPYTGTDEHNELGCAEYDDPLANQDLLGTGDPGNFDWGHKCNGSMQDLFTERMWMTEIHATVHDPTIDNVYNFALQIDTCAGWNIYEGPVPLTPAVLPSPGKQAMGDTNKGTPAHDGHEDPQGGLISTHQLDTYHEVAYHTYYGAELDAFLGGWPLFDVCTDGSSFSFDDTPRGRTVHSGPPPGIGSTAIMRGNSYDFDPASETVGKHRTNCRHNFIDWPYSTYPPGVGEDCYPEDHKTAQIDIYVYDEDPTGGLWAINSNGLTGLGTFAGPGIPNGPNEFPPYGP